MCYSILCYLFSFSSNIALDFQYLGSVFPSFTDQKFIGFLDEALSIQAEASAKKQWHIANMLSFPVPASIIQPLAHNFIFNA